MLLNRYLIPWLLWYKKEVYLELKGKGLIEHLYRALWLRIGGRPWTYMLRDAWHKFEGLWIIGLVAIGAILGHWLWELIFWLLMAFALGYIAGHLFWGKEYIPNQQGEENTKP